MLVQFAKPPELFFAHTTLDGEFPYLKTFSVPANYRESNCFFLRTLYLKNKRVGRNPYNDKHQDVVDNIYKGIMHWHFSLLIDTGSYLKW